MRRSVAVLVSFLLSVFVIGPLPAAAIDGDPGPGCAVDWTTAQKDNTLQALSSIVGARAGQNECYDRFVVDMSGDPPRLLVQYVDEFRSAGTGDVIPLRGGARLLVQVFSPNHSVDPFDPSDVTYDPPRVGAAVDVTGFRTFRQVEFNGTFEAESAFGIGVRERLPFRILTLDGPGDGSRLVVDVAHSWTGASAPQGPSPIGNFESAAGVAGGVQVKGWMLDPDTPNPTYAWVTVDGAGRHLYANVNRPDVGAAFPGYGPNHGFLGTVPASPGAHRVCVTASNVGPGNHTPLGCRNVNVPDPSPFGNFERATGVAGGVEVKGWMADPSSPMQSLYAWVTVDGVGRHLYANVNRPDVAAAFPGYGPNHGFLGTVPASPGAHRVCVTASNIGPGNHTPLGCRNVTVPNPSPFGNFESARQTSDGIVVKGWAADPNTPATPIYVWVTVDGVGQHVYASQNRPDVGAAFPGYGPNHGFRTTIPAAPGAHRVCVTASNVGPGSHTSLGCRGTTYPSIAFWRDFGVWLMGTDGANQRPLVTDVTVEGSADWSPDGTRIAFAALDPSGNYDIWVVNADGSGLRRVTNQPGSASALAPSWSPDGTRLVFATTDWDLWTINVDGSDLRQITSDDAQQNLPAWSPDGSLIAFESTPVENNEVSGDTDLWVIEPDGSNARQVTETGSATQPAWSPDGSQLTFVSYVFPDQGDDYSDVVMDADGSNQRNLTNDPTRFDRSPAWSPDGTTIAFDSAGPLRVRIGPGGEEIIGHEPPGNIYLIPAAGGAKTQITFGDQSVGGPAWEPVPAN